MPVFVDGHRPYRPVGHWFLDTVAVILLSTVISVAVSLVVSRLHCQRIDREYALALAEGDPGTALERLKQGADINIRPGPDMAAILRGAQYSNPALIQAWLVRGRSVNYVDPQTGSTALMVAAATGDMFIAETLLRAGARVDVMDVRSRNALYFALDGAHPRMVRLLLRHGASRKILTLTPMRPFLWRLFGRFSDPSASTSRRSRE